MKVAAIDLGSNTFHLIIAEYIDNKMDILFKQNKPIKLSEDITKNDRIIPAAFARALECLIEFKTILNQYQVQQYRAVATSAVRSAANGKEFIQKAQQIAGVEIEIISGEKEASLIYQAVRASGAIHGKSLIIDIGGGSTEFIFCDENKPYWKKSFDIGAARLMQHFWKSDPISLVERRQLDDYLENTLKELIAFNTDFRATNLIGSAGAFETFVEMIDSSVNINQLKSMKLHFAEYTKLSARLLNSTHQERLKMPNLIPLRVDMIVMACVLTDYIIRKLPIQELRMTTYDLKYGILHNLKKY